MWEGHHDRAVEGCIDMITFDFESFFVTYPLLILGAEYGIEFTQSSLNKIDSFRRSLVHGGQINNIHKSEHRDLHTPKIRPHPA